MPAKFKDIIRVLREYGVTVEAGAKHWKATHTSGMSFTIPAHNGEKTEIDDVYINKTCRTFGINVKEFKKKL